MLGGIVTKTEIKAQKVDDKRETLLSIFEDPDGDFQEMTGNQMDEFIDDNWDTIEEFYTKDSEKEEEEEKEGKEEDSAPASDEGPDKEEKSEAGPGDDEQPPGPDPKTNLA